MSRPLTSLFALYRLTPGRRIYALRRVRKEAERRGVESLLAFIDAAIAADRSALELDAVRRSPRPASTLRADDLELDAVLKTLEQLVAHYAIHDELGATIHGRLFPAGLAQHVQLPYVEQAAANERVLELLREEAEWVEAQGIMPLAKQLEAAQAEFLASLDAREQAETSFTEVKLARELGEARYLEVVVRVLAETLDDAEAREQLLAPIYAADALIQAYRRKRRGSLVDVNPDTGELLDAQAMEAEEAEEAAELSEDAPMAAAEVDPLAQAG